MGDIIHNMQMAVACVRRWRETGTDTYLLLARLHLNLAFKHCNVIKNNHARSRIVRMRNWLDVEIRRTA